MTQIEEAHLHIALDNVERGNGHVSEAAAGEATEGASSVVERRIHLDLPGLPCGLHRIGPARQGFHAGGGLHRPNGGGRRGEDAGEGRIGRFLEDRHGWGVETVNAIRIRWNLPAVVRMRGSRK